MAWVSTALCHIDPTLYDQSPPRFAQGSLRKPRVYPRACGGTILASVTASSATGLSPRVRGNRTARLRALRGEVAMEVNVAMDIGPSTMPLPLMPEV